MPSKDSVSANCPAGDCPPKNKPDVEEPDPPAPPPLLVLTSFISVQLVPSNFSTFAIVGYDPPPGA